jgi:hypothetical protein
LAFSSSWPEADLQWRAALLASIVVAAASIGAAIAAVHGTDSQVWPEIDLEAPITNQLSLTGLATVRVGDGLPSPAMAAAGGGLAYQLSTHWSVAADDYWVRIRSPVSGAGLDLQLPLAAVTYTMRLGSFELDDRNRGERIVGLSGEGWRYRNRLSISHPVTLGPVRRVFVSDEVFYDASRDRWSRNRGQLGLGLRPIGPTALQVYVLRQDDRFSHPGHLNVLGLALAVRL